MRLTFSFCRFVFLLCLALSGLGLPLCWSFVCPPSPLLLFFSVSSLFFSFRPLCLLLSLVSGPGCPGPWRFVLFVLLASRFLALRALSLPLCCLAVGRSLVVAAPPPPLSRCCCRSSLPCACFYFLLLSVPPCFWLSVLSGPGCPGPWRWFVFVVLGSPCSGCFFFASRPSVLRALSPSLCLLVSRWFFPGGC